MFPTELYDLIDQKESYQNPVTIDLFTPRQVGVTRAIMAWIHEKCKKETVNAIVVGATYDIAQVAKDAMPIHHIRILERCSKDRQIYKDSLSELHFVSGQSKFFLEARSADIVYVIQSLHIKPSIMAEIFRVRGYRYFFTENTVGF